MTLKIDKLKVERDNWAAKYICENSKNDENQIEIDKNVAAAVKLET